MACVSRLSAAAQASEHTMRCDADGFAQSGHNAFPHQVQTATASALWMVHFINSRVLLLTLFQNNYWIAIFTRCGHDLPAIRTCLAKLLFEGW